MNTCSFPCKHIPGPSSSLLPTPPSWTMLGTLFPGIREQPSDYLIKTMLLLWCFLGYWNKTQAHTMKAHLSSPLSAFLTLLPSRGPVCCFSNTPRSFPLPSIYIFCCLARNTISFDFYETVFLILITGSA